MAFIARLNFSGQKYRSIPTSHFGSKVFNVPAMPNRIGQNISHTINLNQLKLPSTIRVLKTNSSD